MRMDSSHSNPSCITLDLWSLLIWLGSQLKDSFLTHLSTIQFSLNILSLHFNILWMISQCVLQKNSVWFAGSVKSAVYACGGLSCTPSRSIVLGTGNSQDCCKNTNPDIACNKVGTDHMSVMMILSLTLLTCMLTLYWKWTPYRTWPKV